MESKELFEMLAKEASKREKSGGGNLARVFVCIYGDGSGKLSYQGEFEEPKTLKDFFGIEELEAWLKTQ